MCNKLKESNMAKEQFDQAESANLPESLWEQLLDLERREWPSKLSGSHGSRLMTQRRIDKRTYAAARAKLLGMAQLTLW